MSSWRIGLAAAGADSGTREGQPASIRLSEKDAPGRTFSEIVDRLTKWIPGDTLAVYVPGVTLLAASGNKPSFVFLGAMLLATPLFVLGAAFGTGAPITKRVWTSAALAMAAFAIWSLSVPSNGWQRFTVIGQNAGGVAVAAAVAGLLFGYFAEGLLRRMQN